MKLVITDARTVTRGDLDLSVLNEFAEVVVYEMLAKEDHAAALADADMILCNKTVIDASVMDCAPALKFIGLFATGYNNIDTVEARRRGITVCNAGSYSTMAVAQHVFAMILNRASRVADYNAFVQDGGWKNSATFSPFVFPAHELYGSTLGIVGYGSIGRQVADIGRAFGMNIIAHSRTPKDGVENVTLEELMRRSDYITFHCPLNDQSRGMVGAKELSLCKPTAYIVNTARGGVIVEQDLADALRNNVISGAAIDVLSTEPMAQDCPLFGIENCTVTPHVAWAPIETRIRLMEIVCNNIRAFLAGSPVNVVN